MLDSLFFAATTVFVVVSMLTAWSMVNGEGHAAGIDWLEAIFLSMVSAILLIGWITMSLGQLGHFNLLWLSLIVVGISAAIIVITWRSGGNSGGSLRFKSMGWQEYLLLVLLALSAIIYFRPHEYVLGGTDAGSYMNMGAFLARTGGFVESSPWNELLVEYGDTALRQQPPPLRTSQLQFVGWYVDDTDGSRMLFQFLPFHPALLAVAIGLGGLKGGLLAVPLWGMLGIAALYLLARLLFGKQVALLSALLLTVTPTHLYFGRYPTAEPLTLLLLFAGIFAFQVLWDKASSHPLWGVFAGAALGAAMLTRIDLPLVLLILLAALAWRRWEGEWHRGWTAFSATLGFFLLHLALTVKQMNWPYFMNSYGAIIRYAEWGQLLIAGLLVLALAVALLVFQRRSLDGADLPSTLTGWLESTAVRWTLIALVVGLSLFAYFLYPVVKPAGSAISWPGGTTFPVLNGENWVRIGWYLTPLGLALATYGLAAILYREPLGRLAVFLLIGVLTTIQYVYNIFNTPYHIYAMRRYVPIVIPMLMIYAAYGTFALYRMHPTRIMRPVGAAIGAILLAGMLYQSREILVQRDFAGATNQLMNLNARLQPDAILVIAEPPESHFADTLGVPLHFSFGHDIFTIRNDDGRVEEALASAIDAAAAQSRPLQLIAVDPIFPAVRDSIELQPVDQVLLSTDMLMNTYTDYPSVIQPVEYGIEVYDVAGLRSSSSPAVERVEIDVGTLDTAFIGNGFHGKEVIPNAPTMRWTTGDATVQFPAEESTQVSIEITAMIYRPDGMSPTPVTVWLDGNPIGEFTPAQTWRTHSFDGVGQPTDGYSTLEFQAATFNPAELGLSADARELGFLIDKVVVEQQ